MDSVYPRLLVDDFPAMFRFYRGLMAEVVGATLVKGEESGPYANWDLADDAALVLFSRAEMAEAIGAPSPAARDRSQDLLALVFRVDDVDAALRICLRHGGT